MKAWAAICFLGFVLATAGAQAHHSSVPWYDLEADQISVTGLPDAIPLPAQRERNRPAQQSHLADGRLIRIGWSEDSIRVGQTVTATGFPARQGNGIDSEKIVVEDGTLEWER